MFFARIQFIKIDSLHSEIQLMEKVLTFNFFERQRPHRGKCSSTKILSSARAINLPHFIRFGDTFCRRFTIEIEIDLWMNLYAKTVSRNTFSLSSLTRKILLKNLENVAKQLSKFNLSVRQFFLQFS